MIIVHTDTEKTHRIKTKFDALYIHDLSLYRSILCTCVLHVKILGTFYENYFNQSELKVMMCRTKPFGIFEIII